MLRYRKGCAVLALSGMLVTINTAIAQGVQGTGSVYIPNSIDDPVVYPVTLTGLDGTGFLRGGVADVTNAVTDITPRAYDATHTFVYVPDVPGSDRVHFAETMAYYHSSSFHDYYVESLGFSGVSSPVSIIVFNGQYVAPSVWAPSGSRYDPPARTVLLSTGPTRDDSDAMDGDVIVHEFAHAMQHVWRPAMADMSTVTTTDQAQAIMEGHADYAAASFFNRPEIGEHVAGIWVGGAFIRNVDNFYSWEDQSAAPTTYPMGMVFSGALWDLRAVVGAPVVDTLAARVIETVPDSVPETSELNATFAGALDAAIQADMDLYGGSHADDIRQAFSVHGIGQYDFSTPFPMIRDPGNGYDDQNSIPSYTLSGAVQLAITFDSFVTKLDDAGFTTDQFPDPINDEKTTFDYLEILDGNGNVIGTYTGRELQGATIIVPGDTVWFHLVTDSDRESFGYRVVDIRGVPEPGAMAVLAIGALAMIGRRYRRGRTLSSDALRSRSMRSVERTFANRHCRSSFDKQ